VKIDFVSDRISKTHEAMINPMVGDRFHEMYSHWVYVVKVNRKHVWVMSASPPCQFPRDGILKKYTRDEFINYYSYNSPSLAGNIGSSFMTEIMMYQSGYDYRLHI
jgi:hypothetical protein